MSIPVLHLQHLASAGEQKSQPALQEDTLQESRDGHTMNTSPRLGCEAEASHDVPRNQRRYSHSSCAAGKYYFSRNIPHPRMVCHIPGESCSGPLASPHTLAST